MTLFILTETSAGKSIILYSLTGILSTDNHFVGYALFKARDKKLLKNDNLATEAGTAEGITEM